MNLQLQKTDRINLDEPRYDQSTFIGRTKHFIAITNPLNLFASNSDLESAKSLLHQYKTQSEPSTTTIDEVWKAKWLYDSAYHPDTGEKMFLPGRMSAQVPFNMSITGCMMTFYKSVPAVVFWQWVNQTFNAVVNYTNANKSSCTDQTKQLAVSYVIATGSATATALCLNRIVCRFPPIMARFVPLAAVAAANCLNLPFMRSQEIVNGISVCTADGKRVGESKKSAYYAISQVILSRTIMASPGMILTPLIMHKLEQGNFLKKYPKMNAPMQVMIVGFILIFSTPLCCALFPQRSSLSVSHLEPNIQDKAKSLGVDRVYFNKGL